MDIDQWTGDIHHTISNADALHGYYAFQRDIRVEPTLQLNTIPGFGDTRHSHRQIMTLNETHILGANFVNEARFGFNRIAITFEPNAKLNPVDYGINNGVTTPIGIPQITIVGPGLNFGGPADFPQGRTDTSFVFSDTASYLRGSQSIKFGGEFRRIMADNFTSDTGTFQFPSLAAFQAGQGNNFTITLGDRPANVRQNGLGLFVQDSLRPRTDLSFELGLRYDAIIAPVETENRFVVFDAATDSLVQASSLPDQPQPAAARRRDLGSVRRRADGGARRIRGHGQSACRPMSCRRPRRIRRSPRLSSSPAPSVSTAPPRRRSRPGSRRCRSTRTSRVRGCRRGTSTSSGRLDRRWA